MCMYTRIDKWHQCECIRDTNLICDLSHCCHVGYKEKWLERFSPFFFSNVSHMKSQRSNSSSPSGLCFDQMTTDVIWWFSNTLSHLCAMCIAALGILYLLWQHVIISFIRSRREREAISAAKDLHVQLTPPLSGWILLPPIPTFLPPLSRPPAVALQWEIRPMRWTMNEGNWFVTKRCSLADLQKQKQF